MKNISWKLALIFGLLIACNRTNVSDEKRLLIDNVVTLDSIFINYYENKISHDPPYVFFFYTLKNKSEDTMTLYSRRSEFENSSYANEIISIYERDTFNLFRGDLTPEVLRLKPQDSVHIVLNPSSIQLIDYYRNMIEKYSSMQVFLNDYAIHAINCFSFNNVYYKDSTHNRKVIFRDPNDTIDQVWK